MLFSQLNNNKVLWAVTMLIFNIGSRFVLTDIAVAHEWVLTHAAFKRLVVFCMFFVATRDVVLSVILTLGFIVLFNYLLHEHSSLCIIPGSKRCAQNRRAWLEAVKARRGRQHRRRKRRERLGGGGEEEKGKKEDFVASLDGDDAGADAPHCHRLANDSESEASGGGAGLTSVFFSSLAFSPV